MQPPDAFIPLTPAAPPSNERSDFRLTVLPAAEPAPFRALGQGVAAPAPVPGPTCEPRVSLQREGDRVTAIRIQCTCGQLIELACVYEPGAMAATTAASG